MSITANRRRDTSSRRFQAVHATMPYTVHEPKELSLIVGSLAVILAIALGGCAAVSPRPDNSTQGAQDDALSTYVGQPLSVAKRNLSADTLVKVIDSSVDFGLSPSYGTTAGDDAMWEVLTLCADTPTLSTATIVELAVAPASELSAADIANARTGGFSGDLACKDLPYRP